MNLPEIGELVTVRLNWSANFPLPKFMRGVVDGRLDGADEKRTEGMIGFSVKLLVGEPTEQEQVNLWELDPDSVEGVGWARGWNGPAVEALRVVEALT